MIALAPPHINMLKDYTIWLEKNKFPYNILRESDNIDNRYSVFILAGGSDIGDDKKRDMNEEKWFNQSYGNIPVLGICRGMQLANVLLGGTLYNDLEEKPIKHTSNNIKLINENKSINESSFHNIIYENKLYKVNSRHHQGIKKLSDKLKPLAYSELDNLIEMVEGDKSLFVQWHPEREDVRGMEAESIVYNWLKNHIKGQIDFFDTALMNIEYYCYIKGFTVLSEDRLLKLNEKYDSNFIHRLIHDNPHKLKKVTDRNGRNAVKINIR